MQLLLRNEVQEAKEIQEVKENKAGEIAGLASFGATQKEFLRLRLAGSGDVAAKDAKLAGRGTDVSKGLVESGDIAGFDVDEELIFPGAAVDGAALDLEKIHAMLGEGFK